VHVNEALDKLQQAIKPGTVYGEPVQADGTTLIPVARLRGGGGLGGGSRDGDEGGGGGYGVDARVIGAYVLKDGDVRYVPAVDLNKIILGGQVVAVVALLILLRVLKRRLQLT
jgi:uncharacterized spore protein YtfJ